MNDKLAIPYINGIKYYDTATAITGTPVEKYIMKVINYFNF